jgi:FAD/FMN-containing dehydrogenase
VNERAGGWTLNFAPQDVAALSSVTEGPVLLAGSAELAYEVPSSDISVVHEPDIAVGAANAADVLAAVRFAVEFRLPLAVMAPGHHPPRSAKGGMLVTTSRMNRIHVDPRNRTAIVEAGALWSDVVDQAAELGLAPLVPSYPRLGIVSRTFGWTAGHVRSIELVAADGRFHHVTSVSDPRLFRRLCDSEVSDVDLGVITAMTFVLFR